MFCVHCGNEIGEGNRFCPKCGKEVTWTEERVAEEVREVKQGSSSGDGIVSIVFFCIVLPMWLFRNFVTDVATAFILDWALLALLVAGIYFCVKIVKNSPRVHYKVFMIIEILLLCVWLFNFAWGFVYGFLSALS